MLYSAVTEALNGIFQARRSQKADLASQFLVGIESGIICSTVRLLLGKLWPPWDEREMGIGPETLMSALTEVSEEDVPALRKILVEMGTVAESAMKRKGQHPLSKEPLDSTSVYERLRRISSMSGPDSEHRKMAILRGLFLEASPIEAKYIARTALGSTLAGIGPKTMISALSKSFQCPSSEILRAYNIMPDIGSIAHAASKGELNRIKLKPSTPIRLMVVRFGDKIVPGAYLHKFPSLRVQVHKRDGEISIFTNRLFDITSSLNILIKPLGDINGDFIIDADLICSQDGEICSQAEVVRYINRRRLSRKSRISPALLAYDLIYLQDEDLTSRDYADRRKRLLDLLGKPKETPFFGISSAKERYLETEGEVTDYLRRASRSGCKGLLMHNLRAPYKPGLPSDMDFLMGLEKRISAVIVRAEREHGKSEEFLAKYQVALRQGSDLVPVGWVHRGLDSSDVLKLSDRLQAIAIERDDTCLAVYPQIILTIRIDGVRSGQEGFQILNPKIEEYRLNGSSDAVDDIETLERILKRWS